MDYQRDSIGQIVLEARKETGLHGQELARRLQIDPVSVCNIEKGRHIPSVELGAKIAGVLNLNLREFLFLILRSKHPDLSGVFK
jgi:transcriptional regulator with XRE-family HTH domain